MLSLDSKEHLDIFINFIKKRIPFCILRPGDGEYYILIGRDFNTIDNWHFNGKGSLKDDLFNQLHIASKNPNTYIGLPCPCCSKNMLTYYKSTFSLKETNITYANVFCNNNWHKFIDTFKNDKIPFYYIGPKILSTTHKLNIIENFEIDQYLVNTWDDNKQEITDNLLSWISSRSGIFCFSAGPITKIWASMAFEKYNTNIYIDVGSAFDYDLKKGSNREYTISNSYYSKLVCKF